MPDEKTANIKGAIGVHSVFLAAKLDDKMVGRFTHRSGRKLLDSNGTEATKRSIADVMVYMAGTYGKSLTIEEVEIGLLAAAKEFEPKKETSLNQLKEQYKQQIDGELTEADIGLDLNGMIEDHQLNPNGEVSASKAEKALALVLRDLGWESHRSQVDGDRLYRWYPPKSFFGTEALPDLNEVDDVGFEIDEIDDDIVVEIETDSTDEDWVDLELSEFVEEEPEPKKERKSKPGVKPDQYMVSLMTNQNTGLTINDAGISSFDIAIRYYDFIGNDIATPESEEQLSHKVKLAVGATMKALGWKKKMRNGVNGWHPTDDANLIYAEPEIDPDTVILRKKEEVVEVVEEAEEKSPIESLPRLKEQPVEDDLPWPDMDAEFTDGEPESKSEPESEPEPDDGMEWVKIINIPEGTEDVEEMEVIKDKTMTYVMSGDGTPLCLEWDAGESIWTYTIEGSEE